MPSLRICYYHSFLTKYSLLEAFIFEKETFLHKRQLYLSDLINRKQELLKIMKNCSLSKWKLNDFSPMFLLPSEFDLNILNVLKLLKLHGKLKEMCSSLDKISFLTCTI